MAEARTLSERATGLYGKGAYAEATPPAERALAIKEVVLGSEHPDVANALLSLAGIYRAQGFYARAEPLLLRALALREKTFGKEHVGVAIVFGALAAVYLAQGDHARAESSLRRALVIFEQALGGEHPAVANALDELARLYAMRGDYARAEPLLLRALAIREAALGKAHPQVIVALNNLAVLYQVRGAPGRAEPLLLRALSIGENSLGPEHPTVAAALLNLARLYVAQGARSRAEPLVLRAIAIKETALGKDHPDVAGTLNDLAEFYLAQGASVLAEPLLLRALPVAERAYGKEHKNVAAALHNVGRVYVMRGEYARAESPLLRALAIRESALGKNHPEVASTLNALAVNYQWQGAHARAEPLLLRALAIEENALGRDHPSMASTLNNLAGVYWAQGAYDKAESLFSRSLAIYERVSGGAHPSTAFPLIGLAALSAIKGDVARAGAHFARVEAILERTIGAEVGAMSEARAREYLATIRDRAEAVLSFHAQTAPGDAGALRLALTTTWQRKGRVLDELVGTNEALRRNLTPEVRREFDALAARRTELAARRNELYDPRKAESLQALTDEIERGEAALSAKSVAFRAQNEPVTVERVQAALPEGAALVELVRYRRFEFRGSAAPWREARYAAYVLAREGPPRFADLGEAAPLEAAALAARRALADPRTDARAPLRALDALLLAPIRRVAGEPAHLLLSPDGPLHLVPFGALLDERGRHLLERATVTYLSSGRELLRRGEKTSARSAPLVVAAPDYGPGDWPALPGTAAEAEALRAYFPSAKVVTGAAATKEALTRAQAPRFVHVATHGLFDLHKDDGAPVAAASLGEARGMTVGGLPPPPGRSFAPEDALDASALLFAGANVRPDARLTAREAAGLDLHGTELVVLSACETGLGEVSAGEGVYGLRRALSVAGAASQVVSLWKVSDRATGALMGAYYGELKAGTGRSEALRRAQLGLLREPETAHPFYWAAFVPAGDWRPLEGGAGVPKQGPGAACGCRVVGGEGAPKGGLALGVASWLVMRARRRLSWPSGVQRCSKP